jgi:hypothetical protein
VPETVKFKGFAVVAERPVKVSDVDPPAEIEDELKLQVAPEPQDSTMEFGRSVLGPKADMVNSAVVEPIGTILDRALEESENTGLPVPDSESAVVPFTAFDVTATLPVELPDPVGVKLTATVQLWPTFNAAETVGKLIPQLSVSEKGGVTLMLVIVTA